MPILYRLDDYTPVLLFANASGVGYVHDITTVYAKEGGKWIYKATLNRGNELGYLTHLNHLHNIANTKKTNAIKNGITVRP